MSKINKITAKTQFENEKLRKKKRHGRVNLHYLSDAGDKEYRALP